MKETHYTRCVCDNAITRASENSMLKNSRSIQFAGKVKIKMRKRRTNEREKSTVKYACGLFFGKNTWEFVGWYHLSAYSLRKRDDEGHNGGDASFIIFICVRDAFLTRSRSLSFFIKCDIFHVSFPFFSANVILIASGDGLCGCFTVIKLVCVGFFYLAHAFSLLVSSDTVRYIWFFPNFFFIHESFFPRSDDSRGQKRLCHRFVSTELG